MSKNEEVSFWDWLFSSSCCGSREKAQDYRPEENQINNHSNQQDEEITEKYEQEGGEIEIGGDLEDT